MNCPMLGPPPPHSGVWAGFSLCSEDPHYRRRGPVRVWQVSGQGSRVSQGQEERAGICGLGQGGWPGGAGKTARLHPPQAPNSIQDSAPSPAAPDSVRGVPSLGPGLRPGSEAWGHLATRTHLTPLPDCPSSRPFEVQNPGGPPWGPAPSVATWSWCSPFPPGAGPQPQGGFSPPAGWRVSSAHQAGRGPYQVRLRGAQAPPPYLGLAAGVGKGQG